MQIRRLSIKRYRGLEDFSWRPAATANCLIGPGNSGKSTVLSAIALLLAPYPATSASEFDYLDRNVAGGFEIEACLAIAEEVLATERVTPPLWGWRDGDVVELPEDGTEPVMVVRARGTPDLEMVHEIIPPAGDPVTFSVGFRKKLLLARLAGEERAARELRLTQGSMLDRFLGRTELRGLLASAIGAASRGLAMPAEVTASLQRLAGIFAQAGLPDDLHLGLAAVAGLSLPALLTILQGNDAATAIPLAFAGSGTRQLALIELSAALAGTEAVAVVDEPERGLEPYRQRIAAHRLITLAGEAGQAFLTTHSPAVLECMPQEAVWRMSPGAAPVQFQGEASRRLLRRDSAAFFAPLPFFCEGETEVGFNSAVLPARLGASLELLGIHLIDGQGQPPTLDLIDAFIAASVACAGFVDNEDEFTGRRARIGHDCILFVWQNVRNIEEAIARFLPLDDLSRVIDWGAESTEVEGRHLAIQVRDKIAGATATEIPALIAQQGEEAVRNALAESMSRQRWFKTRTGGEVLGVRLLELGMPEAIEAQLAPFIERLHEFLQ